MRPAERFFLASQINWLMLSPAPADLSLALPANQLTSFHCLYAG
jgi:hypothetical protein